MLSKLNKTHIVFSLVLVIVYLVGIIGHLLPPFKDLFLNLTPYSLLFTFLIFLYLNQWCNLKAILLILGLALFSFSVEMIGVNTGLLFGTYEYGDTLGIKWLGVPLIISLNWVLLNLSAYGVFKNTKIHFIFKALLASLLIVFLDVLIEPVAIKLDYWDWENETIPFKNYLTWFVVSFLIQWVVIRINININSFITFIILLIQFLFFGFLNFLL
jgi:putative membrane protein